MSQAGTAIFLAWRDWTFERLISLCAVLALASMLAPLLVLQGLKNGVTNGMRDRLLQDPSTLIITPKSDAGRYSPAFISELAAQPGASYAIGRTRETATDLTLENPATHSRVPIAFEPATPGEPILKKYDIRAPADGREPEIVLTASAAASLKVRPGESLKAMLGRRTPEGRLESEPMTFRVVAVLPVTAGDRRLAFAPLRLLEDMENYRDYIEVPERGFSGTPARGEREYASFRLYARELDDVEKLAAWLAGRRIEVTTRAREIAAIRSLESAINQVILIISIAVGAGFAAFTLSSAEGAIRRKKRMLGMLRLLGFRRFSLMCYPFTQTTLTAACGYLLSLGIYFAVATAIAGAFSDRGGLACELGLLDALLAIGAVILVSFASSIRSAWQAASLEPSMVIRES